MTRLHAVDTLQQRLVLPVAELVLAFGVEDLLDGLASRGLNVVVEVYARADAIADKAADAAATSVHAKLMADPTLGGRCLDLSELGTEWDYDQSDQAMVIVRTRFAAWYRHQRNSLAA